MRAPPASALNPVLTVLAWSFTLEAGLALFFWPIPDRPRVLQWYELDEPDDHSLYATQDRLWWRKIVPRTLPLRWQITRATVFLAALWTLRTAVVAISPKVMR